MIDMTTWDELEADVIDELRLDSRNVRIELPAGIVEADIVQELFAAERVLNLVDTIVKVGFFTHEVPVVVRRDGELVVVEGNRRVAALKAIQNPYLAPEYQARITKLTASLSSRDSLRRITVKQAPTQDEADQLIAALHTGNQRRAWTPTRQAAFFQAKLDEGKTPAELIEQYPTIDVRDHVVRGLILNLFRSADYRSPELKDYVSKRRFPVSILARLYENDAFLQLAQIDVDRERATVKLRGARKRFAALANVIIDDIMNHRIDTRVLNKPSAQSYQDYMQQLTAVVADFSPPPSGTDPDGEGPSGGPGAGFGPNGTPGGGSGRGPKSPGGGDGSGGSGGTAGPPSGGAGGGSSGGDGSDGDEDGDENQGDPKQASRARLDTSHLRVPPRFPHAIHQMLDELGRINILKFPNASMDLLRTFLEKTIKAYAADLKEEIKAKSSNHGFVFLDNCLVWLEDHLRARGDRGHAQLAEKIRNGRVQGYVASKDHLNAINHNHLIFATAEEVRDAWKSIDSLFRVVLR